MDYKVIGNHAVCGVKPGGTIAGDAIIGDIEHLISSGHLAPVKTETKPVEKEETDG